MFSTIQHRENCMDSGFFGNKWPLGEVRLSFDVVCKLHATCCKSQKLRKWLILSSLHNKKPSLIEKNQSLKNTKMSISKSTSRRNFLTVVLNAVIVAFSQLNKTVLKFLVCLLIFATQLVYRFFSWRFWKIKLVGTEA